MLINKKKMVPYVFLLPCFIIFSLFMVYPIISSVILSFNEFKGLNSVFVGLKNYKILFSDPIFYKSLGNTFIFLLIQVPLMTFLALLLAIFIEEKFINNKGFFRTTIFLPSITALVAYALVFKVMFNSDYGIVNYIISSLGGEKVQWIYSDWPARFTIIIAITWRWTGYNMIILVAGVQGISSSIFDAATIDGANFKEKVFKIIIPMIKPIILFTTITSTIGTLQLFDEPFILTQGGPSNATLTITQYLYQNGFRYLKFGYASAIGYVLVVIIAIFSFMQFKLTKEDN